MNEQINIMLEQIFQQLRTERTAKKEVLSQEYMEWLYEFTISCPDFADDGLDLGVDLEEKDKKNIEMLKFLFQVIREYARNHSEFPSSVTPTEHYYSIQYKDTGFQIGTVEGYEAIYYCKEVDPEPWSIPFKKVKEEFFERSKTGLTNHLVLFVEQLEVLSSEMDSQDITEATSKILEKIAEKKQR